MIAYRGSTILFQMIRFFVQKYYKILLKFLAFTQYLGIKKSVQLTLRENLEYPINWTRWMSN